MSLSARRAWIEISARASRALWSASLSARRAWIEIASRGCGTPIVPVALRKESVDRNHFGNTGIGDDNVALRKESVDRNNAPALDDLVEQVALRKESVDRNAWWVPKATASASVALRKESVDRNPVPPRW